MSGGRTDGLVVSGYRVEDEMWVSVVEVFRRIRPMRSREEGGESGGELYARRTEKGEERTVRRMKCSERRAEGEMTDELVFEVGE
ncbi:hypothetical protein Tco_0109486 [Tanacetum coccineum]